MTGIYTRESLLLHNFQFCIAGRSLRPLRHRLKSDGADRSLTWIKGTEAVSRMCPAEINRDARRVTLVTALTRRGVWASWGGVSLVPSRDANDSAERLNALARYRGIYLSLDCFGGLVTELFRRESIDLLAGWLSGASKHDPLQGDEEPIP